MAQRHPTIRTNASYRESRSRGWLRPAAKRPKLAQRASPGAATGKQTNARAKAGRRRFQASNRQKEIPKQAAIAWIEKARSKRIPDIHGLRSITATIAARISAVARVRG